MTEIAFYKHSLGNGLSFSVYSLSPDIDTEGLARVICSLEDKLNYDVNDLAKTIVRTDHLDSIRDLKLDPQEGEYKVPEPLQPFRKAIQKQWDSEGKFNGPVLIATSEIRFPLKVVQGGYYDYAATRLDAVPATLVPEVYAPEKTVETILAETRFTKEDRARYFGFAHIMWPSKADEFLLVQRAKGMGIAADCVSSPGSTPDVILKKPGLRRAGFSIDDYWSYHFAEEMKDEFHLKWGDFWTEDISVYDDKKLTPFGAVNIITELSTKEISEKAYADPKVLKEHSILYGIPSEAIRSFLKKFPVFPSIARVMDMISE